MNIPFNELYLDTHRVNMVVVIFYMVWLWLLLFIFQNELALSDSAEPGYLDFDNLPETNFSCTGKVIGGYYADLETDCQMFHVCTIGQLEEPMDIKFLCLNGTVFDQETRVCERVDEVDCSNSEHFYSLNLELYGNTAPPIIKADASTVEDEEEEVDGDVDEEDYEDVYDETTTPKTTTVVLSTTTTTKKPSPVTTHRPYQTTHHNYYHSTVQTYSAQQETSSHPDDDNYELIDDNENNEPTNSNTLNHTGHNFPHYNTDSQLQRPLPTSNDQHKKVNNYDNRNNEDNTKSKDSSDNSQIFSPQDFIYHHNKHSSPNQKTPAISFQQQSFSTDGQNSHVSVTTHTGRGTYNIDGSKDSNRLNENSPISRTYLTSSTPRSDMKTHVEKVSMFNGYQPFSIPKRTPLIPTPNTQGQTPTGHPGIPSPVTKHQNEPLYFSFNKSPLTPQGFKSSQGHQTILKQNIRPLNKLSAKPFQSYQPSERHEVSIMDTEYENFEKLTPAYPFIHQDFSQYHFEHKRSQEPGKYEDKSSSEKSSETTTVTSKPYYNTWATRNNNYTKSLPRVIVTASASVSDSNGKKLNYTVGNIVHAVKPLVPTNYDNYKESDVLLDPFFLDVPKLKMARRKRSHRIIENKTIFKKSAIVENIYTMNSTSTIKPVRYIEMNSKSSINIHNHTNKTSNKPDESTHWTPPDYVDDNYEPVVYSSVSVNNKPGLNNTYKADSISDKTEDKLQKTITKLDKKVENLLPEKSTTENNIAKTTLDIAQLESITISFRESTLNPLAPAQSFSKYNLTSVNVVKLSDKNSSSLTFSCKGKKYYKFYPDKTDCRTFHYCSPGFSSLQVLDTVFRCDLGTFFHHHLMNCTTEKPNDCEL